MTDIEQEALALVNEVTFERGGRPYISLARMGDAKVEALCRAIEQHEAFRQEASKLAQFVVSGASPDMLAPLIIPAPEPDPLVEVLKALPVGRVSLETYSRNVRAALDARGLEIREKGK